MNQEIQRLVKLALEDKVLTDREREILFNKAEKYGVDLEEFELYLENEVSKKAKNRKPNNLEHPDGFNITNQELILRTQKWINQIKEDSYKGIIEEFPTQKKGFELSTIKEFGVNLLGAASSMGVPTSKVGLALNLTKALVDFAGKPTVSSEREIKNSEILEIASYYLSLLEIRANDEFMQNKFEEFSLLYKNNLAKYDQKKNPSWLKKFF